MKPRARHTAKIGISIIIAGVLAIITEAQFESLTARVERVIDGELHAVRLIGVNTPETKHPTKAVQYFGREAGACTTDRIEDRTVRLERNITGDTRDRYGRLLRYVYVNGENFNAVLIREGHAHAYRR